MVPLHWKCTLVQCSRAKCTLVKYFWVQISSWDHLALDLLFQISNALQRSRNCDKNKLKKAYTIEWNHKCILFCWSFLVVIKAFFLAPRSLVDIRHCWWQKNRSDPDFHWKGPRSPCLSIWRLSEKMKLFLKELNAKVSTELVTAVDLI